MHHRLNRLVERIGDGADEASVGGLSTGERCYVALAAGRYDLLPAAYADPIEAWRRLGPEWRLAVCAWRGWPKDYARG